MVTVEGGPTIWIHHQNEATQIRFGQTVDSDWLNLQETQRLYLDIAAANETVQRALIQELQNQSSVRPIFTASATWLVFTKSIRAISQGLALTVSGDQQQVGMNDLGVTIHLDDLEDYSANHPVVNLEVDVQISSPQTPFQPLAVVLGQDEASVTTLDDLKNLRLDAQVMIVNRVPERTTIREAIATHLHLAGAVAVIFPQPSLEPSTILKRLQEAESIGLNSAILSLKHLDIYGQPGLNPGQVVAQAVTTFNTAFNKGLRAFKAAQRSQKSNDWARAGHHFETILQTLEVISTREAKALLKHADGLPELSRNARLKKLATVLPKQSSQLQLVARDKLSNIRAAQGEHAEAIALRELLTAAFAARGEHQKAAKSLEEQGNVYLSQADRTKAIQAFRECALFSAMAGIAEQEGSCLLRSARTLERDGKPNDALDDIKKAAELFENIQSPKQVQALRALGHLHESSLSDYERADQLFKQALKLAVSLEDQHHIHNINLDRIRLLYTRGEYEGAMKRLQTALIEGKSKSPREQLTLRLEIAKVAWYQGDYPAARKEQAKALEIARRFGWSFQEIQARSLGGLISMNLGDLKGARIAMLDALGLAQRTGRQNEVAIQSNNLGNVLREQGQYTEALSYYRKALKIEDSVQNQEGRAYAIRNMGLTHARMENPKRHKPCSKRRSNLARLLAIATTNCRPSWPWRKSKNK